MKKKTQYKALWCIFLIGLMVLFNLVFVSSSILSTDTIKSYDAENQRITLINKLDLTKNVASIQLTTPLINYVGYGGVFKVAEFKVTSYIDIQNALSGMKFYNMVNRGEELQRNFEYKVKGYEDYEVLDYSKVCELSKNGTNECSSVVSGKHTEQREIWTPLEKTDFLKGDIKTIGIFTYVYKGDRVEWIPTMYSKEISEWASWVASLESGLVAYYSFDDGTGTTINDNHTGNYDGTVVNGNGRAWKSGASCKVGGCLDLLASNDYAYFGTAANNGFDDWNNYGNNFAYSFWANFISWGNTGIITKSNQDGNHYGQFTMYGSTNPIDMRLVCKLNNTADKYFNTGLPVDNEWFHIVVQYNQTHIQYWINGVVNNTEAENVDITSLDSPVVLGVYYDFGQNANFSVDELGYWNRTLTPAEIENLYNDGNGIGYKEYGASNPAVTLDSPTDYYNTSKPTIIFNTTVLEYNVGGVITNVTLYIDGVLNETNTSGVNGTYRFTKILSEAKHNWSILAYNNNSKGNQSATRTLWLNTTPQVTLSAPDDYSNLTYNSIWFNSSVISVYTIKNVSLFINGTINSTNTSGINGTYKFNVELGDAYYNWSILACSTLNACNQSETRTLTVDSTFPVITISSPTNGTNVYFLNHTTTNIANATINWTVIEENPSVCLITNVSSGDNLTGTCNEMNKTFFLPYGNYLFRVYANDTFGHNSSSSTNVTYRYRVYEINQSYTPTVTEYSFENYSANAYIDSLLSVSSVIFDYNGTNYTASKTTIGNYTKVYKNLFQLPTVASDSNNTYSFYLILNDSSVVRLNSQTQQENNLSFGACSSFANRLFNFTLVDEKLQTDINGTIETNILIRTSDGLTTLYNWTINIKNTTLMLCSNVNLTNSLYYNVTGTVKYSASNGNYSAVTEYYNFINYVLDNSSQKINNTLFDLNTSQSTEFQLTFKDSSGLSREGVLIYVYRQYVPEGFKIVELPKTDSNGQVVVHLVRNDIIYNFIAVDSSGNVLGSLNNVIAFCQDYTIGNCVINFNIVGAETGLEHLINESGVSYTLAYSNTSNIITLTFASTTTASKDVRMEVISSAVVTNRTVCNTSLSAVSGTLTCDVSALVNTSASVNVKIFVDGVQKIQDYLSFDNSNWNVGGLIFFGFLLILTTGIFFMESKEGLIIATILGFIVLIALGIVKGKIIGITSGIIWLVIVGIILLIKLNGEKQ